MSMTSHDGVEVPWFTSPPDAKIARGGCEDGEVIYGHLHFIGPDGQRAVVHLTLGPTTEFKTEDGSMGSPIWHIDLPGEDGIATISPSIHFIGHWHSPNPVQFRIVGELT